MKEFDVSLDQIKGIFNKHVGAEAVAQMDASKVDACAEKWRGVLCTPNQQGLGGWRGK